jgi:hypothetical protein
VWAKSPHPARWGRREPFVSVVALSFIGIDVANAQLEFACRRRGDSGTVPNEELVIDGFPQSRHPPPCRNGSFAPNRARFATTLSGIACSPIDFTINSRPSDNFLPGERHHLSSPKHWHRRLMQF